MRLSEWKDSTGNTVSTGSSNTMIGVKTSSKSNTSFEERFRRLLRYHVKHNSLSLDRVLRMKIYDDGFTYTEHRDKKDEVDVIVHIEPSSETWQLKVYINRKQEVDFTGTGYVDLLKWLRKYLVLPVAGTPEYSNILHEWLDSNGKKINTSSATVSKSPSTKNYPDQTGIYKKLLSRIDADNICRYVLNLLDDRILAITVDTVYKKNIGIKIIYKPYVPCYLLQVTTDRGVKELNDLTFQDILNLLQAAAVLNDTSLDESINSSLKAVPEKLYHATYLPFLDSIKAKGLGNTENKMWSDSKTGVVYLANDPWVAESYAEESEWLEEIDDPDKYLNNIIILEVDVSKLDSNRLFIDSNVLLDEQEENATWEYHGIIPWEAIKIFNSSIAEDFKLYENLWD